MSALRFHELTVKHVSPEAAGSVAITFDIPAGQVFLRLDYADTVIDPGKYCYDMEITLGDGYRFSPTTVQLSITRDYTHG